MKLFYIMGKSASGKDSIYKRLLKDIPWLRPLVTHTTRPIRFGESNGVEYYFDTESVYDEFKRTGKILEERVYDVFVETGSTRWYYYTVNDHQFTGAENLLGIGTLESYVSIKSIFCSSIVPILIDVFDPADRLDRAIARERKQSNPNYVELCRRFIGDEEDFSPANIRSAQIEKVFYNQNIDDCIEEIKSYIWYELWE